MEGSEDQTPARRRDPTQLRISDEDRHKVAEILREAAGDGRIDLTELDERLESAYAAKTYADLVPITMDLPTVQGSQPVVHPESASPAVVTGGADHERGVAIMSGIERKGVWVVPRSYDIFLVMGGAELDLRQAKFAAQEVVISVNAFWGGAEIIVNPQTNVIVEGIGIMGAFGDLDGHHGEAELDEGSPTVRIKGVAIMSGVGVKRRPMPDGTPRRRRRLH